MGQVKGRVCPSLEERWGEQLRRVSVVRATCRWKRMESGYSGAGGILVSTTTDIYGGLGIGHVLC